ncbi:hypothetical protein BBJ28_00006606 [Nothophytophthora sp. Chile5]|nr:hypothetical protein BBJ28_00006606 [Nothophytophthora sp. Chile5]
MEDAQLASQLANRLPQAIVEEEEYTQFGYHSGRRPVPQFGTGLARGGRALRAPYSNTARDLGASSTSTASGRSDDYDIVDPATLREVEHRNTELLMQDGRFVKFSFASDADIYDVDDDFDEHGRRQDEHAL